MRASPAADIDALLEAAATHLRRGEFRAARDRLREIVRRRSDDAAAWRNLGAALQGMRSWRAACAAYAKALALRPDDEVAFLLAAALAVDGQTEAAIAAWRALALGPASRAAALARLAILRPSAVGEAELAAMQEEAASAKGEAAVALAFALGAVLEARGEPEAAFRRFSNGAALRLAALQAAGVDPLALEAGHEASAQTVQRLFTTDFLARLPPGDERAAPIFVVGFPRCGSSLLEQILASHPAVQGLGETGAFGRAADAWYARLPGIARDPQGQGALAAACLAGLRAAGLRPGARPVDKTLENYLHLGLIARAFPRAVIVHCLREPADACFSVFAELFTHGNETLFDLAQIGREYVRYRSVMEHWRASLPGRVHEIRYEDLVAAPEREIHRLITETCGLEWAPQCLRFFETRRPVATASADQVRRPIYAASVGRWRAYKPHLTPLMEALGPFAPGPDGG